MTEEEIKKALGKMERDASLSTQPISVTDTTSSERLVSFQQRHAEYLKLHPKVNPQYYLSNLRTMIKIRP